MEVRIQGGSNTRSPVLNSILQHSGPLAAAELHSLLNTERLTTINSVYGHPENVLCSSGPLLLCHGDATQNAKA